MKLRAVKQRWQELAYCFPPRGEPRHPEFFGSGTAVMNVVPMANMVKGVEVGKVVDAVQTAKQVELVQVVKKQSLW